MSWMRDGLRLMSDSELQEAATDASKYPPDMRDAIQLEVDRRKSLPPRDDADGAGPSIPFATSAATPPREPRRDVLNRYLDAYRVANLTVWFGNAIKIAGAVMGILVFFALADTLRSPRAGIAFGLIVAGIAFCFGVLVAAQGQLLRATLDTAINSSPFLNDDQRLRIMSAYRSVKS